MRLIRDGIKAWVRAMSQWFDVRVDEYPNDAQHLLIKRFLADSSWFDAISTDWAEKSFFSKIAYMGSAMLIGGLVGLLVNAVLLVVLVTGALIYSLHSLLITHDWHRRRSALIFAAETKALEANLAASQICFFDASKTLTAIQNTITSPIATLSEASMRLDTAALAMQQQHELLAPIVDGITTETHALINAQKAVVEGFGMIASNLNTYSGALEQSMTNIQTMDDAIEGFSSTSRAFKTTQDRFSQSVSNFCMFRPITPRGNAWTGAPFHAQLPEDEALIAHWSDFYPYAFVVSACV